MGVGRDPFNRKSIWSSSLRSLRSSVFRMTCGVEMALTGLTNSFFHTTLHGRRGQVNLTLKMKGDMIIENLNLKPMIDAMMRDFLEISLWSFVILLDGKNRERNQVVRSSHVEMDLAGRLSSQLLA
uniref:Uncharacterized protein n=1 Tax=Tanacetum cinerariifolium TaxID=118510 RepID=A0A6L2MPL0_TANCI|nr:hypothetical protein [Tanacetum cinerariifolium]